MKSKNFEKRFRLQKQLLTEVRSSSCLRAGMKRNYRTINTKPVVGIVFCKTANMNIQSFMLHISSI